MGDYGPIDPLEEYLSTKTLSIDDAIDCSLDEFHKEKILLCSGIQGSMAAQEVKKPRRKARVLILHGHAQSGAYMKLKTRFLTSILEKTFPRFPDPGFDPSFPEGYELFYATAPNVLEPANETYRYDAEGKKLDAWCWGLGDYATEKIQGLDKSIKSLLQLLQEEGPFVGIVGFSTGATAGLILASLAERGASPEVMKCFKLDQLPLPPRPFRFGIFFSGCILSHSQYRSIFYPKIKTPVLHFIGKYDTYLPECEMLKFSRRCRNSATVYHSGSHFVPRYKHCQEDILEFVKEQSKRPSWYPDGLCSSQ